VIDGHGGSEAGDFLEKNLSYNFLHGERETSIAQALVEAFQATEDQYLWFAMTNSLCCDCSMCEINPLHLCLMIDCCMCDAVGRRRKMLNREHVPHVL
jgi:hypothetical protein